MTQLRNKQVVNAEVFESVTIMFTSMVGFDKFCHDLEPLPIVMFLNQLYTRLDIMLQSYDVYKVETIKDGYVVFQKQLLEISLSFGARFS